MDDAAHGFTDDVIDELTVRFAVEYRKAKKDLSEKIPLMLSDYDLELKSLIGEEKLEYARNRSNDYGLIAILAGVLALSAVETDRMVLSIADSSLPNVTEANSAFVSFVLGRTPSTVQRSAKLSLDEQKDRAWNTEKFMRVISDGMAEGLDSRQIAEKAVLVLDMDMRSALRATRTAMTRCESEGRISAMRSAGVEKLWVAVMDSRTRHSHRYLNGQHVKIEDSFITESGVRIAYPGDPDCPDPSEIYNCRCTLLPWNGKPMKWSEADEAWKAWSKKEGLV